MSSKSISPKPDTLCCFTNCLLGKTFRPLSGSFVLDKPCFPTFVLINHFVSNVVKYIYWHTVFGCFSLLFVPQHLFLQLPWCPTCCLTNKRPTSVTQSFLFLIRLLGLTTITIATPSPQINLQGWPRFPRQREKREIHSEWLAEKKHMNEDVSQIKKVIFPANHVSFRRSIFFYFARRNTYIHCYIQVFICFSYWQPHLLEILNVLVFSPELLGNQVHDIYQINISSERFVWDTIFCLQCLNIKDIFTVSASPNVYFKYPP